MADFIIQSGIFGWILIIIPVVNVVMFILSTVRLRDAKPEEGLRILQGINSILFWGVLCGLLGFLGQYCGIYQALNAISRAEKINTNLLLEGFAISFTTTIMGMIALLLSALAWFILYRWYRRKTYAWDQGRNL